MKKTAGFLKALTTLALIFEILGAVIVCGVFLLFAFTGRISDLAAKTGNAITFESSSLSIEEIDAAKPLVMAALGLALVVLIFTILGTVKTRTALSECKKETPFSETCIKAIRSSARLQIIGGLIGVIGGIVLSFMASGLTVNGSPVGRSSVSLNLTFLIYAVQKYLLYHVAEYGRSLEEKLPKTLETQE